MLLNFYVIMSEIIFLNYLNKGFVMFKKAIFASLACGICLHAQMVNGIAAIVDNEPITLFELYKAKEQLKTDEAQALNLLIRDRLESVEIKNLGLSVTPFEINERIEQIASKNNMTSSQFRSSAESQGINFAEFKNEVEKNMLKEKLYKNIMSNAGKNISESKARAYYEANSASFNVFSTAEVTLFHAQNEADLRAQRGSMGAVKGVKAQNLTLNYNEIDPQFAALIANTPDGGYTQILRGQEGFDMFLIRNKIGSYTPEFEQIKDEIMNAMYQGEQENIMRDYFDKLRAKAKIQILR